MHIIKKNTKTVTKITVKTSQEGFNMDEQTRKLLIDGCTMGIKTPGEKTHQYDKADKKAADLAQKIIRTDEELMKKLKDYL